MSDLTLDRPASPAEPTENRSGWLPAWYKDLGATNRTFIQTGFAGLVAFLFAYLVWGGSSQNQTLQRTLADQAREDRAWYREAEKANRDRDREERDASSRRASEEQKANRDAILQEQRANRETIILAVGELRRAVDKIEQLSVRNKNE